MLKNEVMCENLTKNNILYRASLRGLKKCTSCGYINGQRALICRNINCDLRIKRLAAIKPFDPIQLITYGHTKLYSLRSKEKLLQPRNFVKITELVESQPQAVCYVDNCKYDSLEPTHLVCRHIKACKVLSNVPQAEVYPIYKSILWNLNIPVEQKQRLWNLYQVEEKLIHPVQKLSSSLFVVKCEESKIFPAGRLHVTVFGNKVSNKSGSFFCSCKKIKLILEPDDSVTMKPEICDHLLLLVAAILNKPEGKMAYSKFLELLQYLWMPTSLNTPIMDCDTTTTQYMHYDLSLEQSNASNIKMENVAESDNSDDIFNFTEELFAENNIPDFSDIILDVNNDKTSTIQLVTAPEQKGNIERGIKDPKLNATTSGINDEEMELNFLNLKSAEPLTTTTTTTSSSIAVTQTRTDFNENDLSVIEQFQLNNNIQVSNDNIELAKDIESLNNLESQAMDSNFIMSNSMHKQISLLKASSNVNNIEGLTTNPSTIIQSVNEPTTITVPKSTVLKHVPVKVVKISSPLKKLSLKQIQISKINPKNIVVLKSNQSTLTTKQIVNVIQPAATVSNHIINKPTNLTLMPSMSYESWLNHIIEILNDGVTIQDSPTVKNTFHVPVAIFNNFSKSFILSNKKKLPNSTSVLKSNKYKDHIKYTWRMNQASVVQRIFASKNMKIELERSYQLLADGSYELYTPTTIESTDNTNFRPIYPKIQLYKAFVQFPSNAEQCVNNVEPHKYGLKVEWLPSAFPKSNFGLMTIEFCVSVKESLGAL